MQAETCLTVKKGSINPVVGDSLIKSPYFYNQVVLIDVPSLQLGRYSLQEEQGDSEAITW